MRPSQASNIVPSVSLGGVPLRSSIHHYPSLLVEINPGMIQATYVHAGLEAREVRQSLSRNPGAMDQRFCVTTIASTLETVAAAVAFQIMEGY